MAPSDEQRRSIESSLERLARAPGRLTRELREELVERRWGTGARRRGRITVQAVKTLKAGRGATVEARVHYEVTRADGDGGGPAEDNVEARLRVSADDIGAQAPEVTSFRLTGVEDWRG